MPANLPPEYFQAEKVYRQASTPQEKVEALRAMLALMPHHKGTDRLRAELTAKIARFSKEAERRPFTAKRGGGYYLRKEGAGQVALVGLPNCGKSQLLTALTEATPEVGDYPFTTKAPIPGMMKFENVQIQLLDLPAPTDRSAQSWLHGMLRNADALIVVLDLGYESVGQMETILAELQRLRIVPVGEKGGEKTEILTFPKRTLVLANKADLEGAADSFRNLERHYGSRFPVLSVSAAQGDGLEKMRGEVFNALEVIRVYTKTPGQKPSYEEPFVVKKGSTVSDVAESIHKDFAAKLKYAQVWGSGKFSGQRVKRDHILADGDVVELHI